MANWARVANFPDFPAILLLLLSHYGTFNYCLTGTFFSPRHLLAFSQTPPFHRQVDLPIAAVWERLVATAKASRGTLSFPVSAASEGVDVCARAGCNLLEDAPRIRDWLLNQYPEKRLCIGSYAYLDSADFVRVSVAMDAIASEFFVLFGNVSSFAFVSLVLL